MPRAQLSEDVLDSGNEVVLPGHIDLGDDCPNAVWVLIAMQTDSYLLRINYSDQCAGCTILPERGPPDGQIDGLETLEGESQVVLRGCAALLSRECKLNQSLPLIACAGHIPLMIQFR